MTNVTLAWLKLFIFFVAMPDTFGFHCHNNDHRCLLSKYCWQSIQRVTPPSCCRFSGIGSPQSLHSVNDGRLNFGALAMARSMDCWATSLAWSIMSVIFFHRINYVDGWGYLASFFTLRAVIIKGIPVMMPTFIQGFLTRIDGVITVWAVKINHLHSPIQSPIHQHPLLFLAQHKPYST